MSDDRAQARGAPTAGLLPVLGRCAAIIERFRPRHDALDAEAASLRSQVRRVEQRAEKSRGARRAEENGDAELITIDRLHRIRPSAEADGGVDVQSSRLDVRPYMMTRGRTVPRRDVAVEALVVTADDFRWDPPSLMPEYYEIANLCQQAHSLAEISALLDMPLTVARILVADMAVERLVHIYDPPAEHAPDQRLLEKVLGGLRKL
ncbi:DUF742 domain-containing protein [Thermostaphylospora chromogena]|uniref:DUF742 domain-containing protein n=1 Tax=Thermostaphylospora chromogena TaxID=35622 RepID=A0A1H1CNQ3_9ACTN|nr:DUF742 domain-containing protein [Thermostaphylospora chromogena]SDQ65820.1 Protein of unknown function [Thermostaphylospora chromogena]